MANPLIPGIHTPTGNLAMGFDEPTGAGTNTNINTTDPGALTRIAPYKLMILTAQDETWAQALAALPNPPRIPQYILGFEVEISSLSPFHNGWSFGIQRCVQNIAFKPDAWWHFGKTTVFDTTVNTGATSFAVTDGTQIQDITSPGVGILDIFSSTGTYKGMIKYGGLSGNTVSGIPSGSTVYGSIGYDPGTINTLTTGTYTPGIQCSGGLVTGDIIWSRATSNTSGLNGGGFFPEPRSATFATWATQSIAYYRSTVTGANSFTDIFLDNTDDGNNRFPGPNSSPGTSGTPIRPTGTTTNGVFTVNASGWTGTPVTVSSTEYLNSYAQLIETYATLVPARGVLWGNCTGTLPWSSPATYISHLQTYAAAGLSGVFMEPGGSMAGEYNSPGWFTPTKIDNALSIYTAMNSIGVAVMGGNQVQSSDRTDTNGVSGATVGYSAASAVITDSKILAGDLWEPVKGTNIPIPAYVGTVTAGTSFRLSSTTGFQTDLLPTGSAASTPSVTVSHYFDALAEARDEAGYAFHLIAWAENNYYFGPVGSRIGNSYHQDWPRVSGTPYLQCIGRPTGAYQKTGTNPVIYSRQFEYGSVSVSVSTTASRPTVTFTRTLR